MEIMYSNWHIMNKSRYKVDSIHFMATQVAIVYSGNHTWPKRLIVSEECTRTISYIHVFPP